MANPQLYENWKKSDLLKVAWRPTEWKASDRVYGQIVVVGNRHRHDSGFMCMTVLGMWYDEDGDSHIEKCAEASDDLCWHVPPSRWAGEFSAPDLRVDCLWPSGALQFRYASQGICVGNAQSSIDIKPIMIEAGRPTVRAEEAS